MKGLCVHLFFIVFALSLVPTSAQTVRCSPDVVTINSAIEVAPNICQVTPITTCIYAQNLSSSCICDAIAGTVLETDNPLTFPNYTCINTVNEVYYPQNYGFTNFQGTLQPAITMQIGGILNGQAAVGFQFPGDGNTSPLAAFKIDSILIVVNGYDPGDSGAFVGEIRNANTTDPINPSPGEVVLQSFTMGPGTGQYEQIVTFIPTTDICLKATDSLYFLLRREDTNGTQAINWFTTQPALAPSGDFDYIHTRQRNEAQSQSWFNDNSAINGAIYVQGSTCCKCS